MTWLARYDCGPRISAHSNFMSGFRPIQDSSIIQVISRTVQKNRALDERLNRHCGAAATAPGGKCRREVRMNWTRVLCAIACPSVSRTLRVRARSGSQLRRSGDPGEVPLRASVRRRGEKMQHRASGRTAGHRSRQNRPRCGAKDHSHPDSKARATAAATTTANDQLNQSDRRRGGNNGDHQWNWICVRSNSFRWRCSTWHSPSY